MTTPMAIGMRNGKSRTQLIFNTRIMFNYWPLSANTLSY